MKKIKRLVMTFAAMLALLAPAAVPAAVSAQANVDENLKCGANLDFTTDPTTDCETDKEPAGKRVNNIISAVINIISLVVGVVAVVMIIISGLRYVTSSGDSGKVGDAKNGILYAIVGLIVVALAQVIVRFVVQRATETE